MADLLRVHFRHDKHFISCTKSLSEQDNSGIPNLLPILGRTLGTEIREPSLVTASLLWSLGSTPMLRPELRED